MEEGVQPPDRCKGEWGHPNNVDLSYRVTLESDHRLNFMPLMMLQTHEGKKAPLTLSAS